MALAFALLLAAPALVRAQHWPQWRGPGGLGVSSDTGIATRWGPDDNVAWRVPLEGLGTSTPVICSTKTARPWCWKPGRTRGSSHGMPSVNARSPPRRSRMAGSTSEPTSTCLASSS